MDIKRFIEECNRSPVFKNCPPVTRNSLKSIGLIKKDYELNDINTANKLLFFMTPKPFLNTSKAYAKQDREHKDLQHLYRLDLEKNKERIREIRKALHMPYEHCGMISVQFENNPCEYINIPLSNLNKQYKNWLTSFIKDDPEYQKARIPKFYIAKKVDKAVEAQIYALLSEWNLSIRYFDALVSLVLFNQIIPAQTDILLRYTHLSNDKNHPFLSISFDVDTTKEDLIKHIQEIPNEVLEKYKKYSGVKQYKRSRIAQETRDMKKIYMQRKKGFDTDNKIFQYIASIYGSKPSTVRKRITGK